MITDTEKIESGKFIYCACHNLMSVDALHCPFCHKFNAATSAKNCPTCGQVLVAKPEV